MDEGAFNRLLKIPASLKFTILSRKLVKSGASFMGKSIERDGIFGKYTEHFDDEGNKVGESHKRQSIIEDYTEHFDINHTKIGQSKDREGIFEDYVERQGHNPGTDSSGVFLRQQRRKSASGGSTFDGAHTAKVHSRTNSSSGSGEFSWLFVIVGIVLILVSRINGEKSPTFPEHTVDAEFDTYRERLIAGELPNTHDVGLIKSAVGNEYAVRRCVQHPTDLDTINCYVLFQSASAGLVSVRFDNGWPRANQIPIGFDFQGHLLINEYGELLSYDPTNDRLKSIVKNAWNAGLSSDKRYVAFTPGIKDQSTPLSVELIDLQSSKISNLATLQGMEPGGLEIRWLPNNQTIVFETVSIASRAPSTWTIERDGSNLRKVVDGQLYDLKDID